MTTNPCVRRTLAVSDFAMAEQCTCGAVHVTIGPVTLRLAASAISEIATTMTEAARGLALDQMLNVSGAHERARS
jgi:hypothetical protein